MMSERVKKILPAAIGLIILILIWELCSVLEVVPSHMLPSPSEVITALITDFRNIGYHGLVTLKEALAGLALGVLLSFLTASLMDRFLVIDRAFYPIMVITQTIPAIAIAPILVLWMGFGMGAKITLVVITTFFPITVGVLDGYKCIDSDEINLMRTMGANRMQIFWHVKIPEAMPQFFSGLKISASYAIVGAVIAEWLGGYEGLGVYMTRVKKAYAFDKMFAVVLFIIIISLLLIELVKVLARIAMPWKREGKRSLIGMVVLLLVTGTLVTGTLVPVTTVPVTKGDRHVTFCLDWTPNTNHTGLYVAKALGYYDEAGIEVDIVQPPENDAVSLCAAGQVDFAIDAQDWSAAAFDSEDDLKIITVAAILDHNSAGIISRAGEGLDTPAGLTGHTYASFQTPIELSMLETLVNENGGDFSKVKIIPNEIVDEPAALMAKQTDAVLIYHGWGKINAEVQHFDHDFWAIRDIAPVFDYYTPIILANTDFLAADPDLARDFLAATKKGYEYAMAHPKEAAQMLIDGDDTGALAGNEELVMKSQQWMSQHYVEDGDSWGVIDAERWDAYYGWLYEKGLTKKDLRGKGYTNEYLPEE